MTRRPDGSRVADYDYELPAGRIARYPAERRDASRLLALPRGGGPVRHLRFSDLPDLMRTGDLLVVNESRVLPARLLGRKPTGASAEVLLVRPWSDRADGGRRATGPVTAAERSAPDRATGAPAVGEGDIGEVAEGYPRLWEALVRPGGKLKPGRSVDIAEGFRVVVLGPAPGGGRVVRLETDGSVEDALDRHGHMPLPPYLGRDDEPLDRDRYQTVFARAPGSVAAPTAGLHFTPELLSALAERGVRRTALTLHVGVGTFRPVEADDPARHEMHAELYGVTEEVARAVADTRATGGRVWAVGTTVVRTLESVTDPEGVVRAGSGWTDLFIRPPWRFRAVDALITNFHLPRSTLLMLVAAFGGYHPVQEAYAEAIREGYRFYSYGDAMAVL